MLSKRCKIGTIFFGTTVPSRSWRHEFYRHFGLQILKMYNFFFKGSKFHHLNPILGTTARTARRRRNQVLAIFGFVKQNAENSNCQKREGTAFLKV